jgi:hypothetical protein
VRRPAVLLALVLATTLGVTVVVLRGAGVPLWPASSCTATANDTTVDLSVEEAEAAGRIAAGIIASGQRAKAASAALREGIPGRSLSAEDAGIVSSALTGNSPEGFTCELSGGIEEAPDQIGESGLTARADDVLADLREVWSDLSLGGFEPGGVNTGHMEGSAHYEGRAIDIFVRPVNETNRIRGWAIASYLLSQADRLQIRTIIFDDRIWTRPRSSAGWRDFDVPASSRGDRAILEHRDHVHVDVFD